MDRLLQIGDLAGLSSLAQATLLRLYVLSEDGVEVRKLGKVPEYPVSREDVDAAVLELEAAGLVEAHRERRRARSVTLLARVRRDLE